MVSKRERYRNANMRGGMGVRKRLSEESQRSSYRLNGVQSGSVVVRLHYPFGRWKDLPFDVGVISRKTAATVFIRWSKEEEVTSYSAEDARYEVDRGRWRILGVMRGNPLEDSPIYALIEKLRAESAPALTGEAGAPSIDDAGDADTPPTEETEMDKSNAALEREAAKKAIAQGELKERETYTAKQVATRCGTDSKTMRKFFRSTFSTVEPVGQGGRYEFDARDFPKIKGEFDAWTKRAAERRTRPTDDAKPETVAEKHTREQAVLDARPEPKPLDQVHTEEGVSPALEDEEPSPEDLAEIDDLDLDDLDAIDDEDEN